MDIITGEIGSRQITLPAVLDSANAAALKAEISEVIGEGWAAEINAAAVERISTPVLQLLVAAALQSGAVRIDTASSAFMEAAGIIGATEVLGLEKE